MIFDSESAPLKIIHIDYPNTKNHFHSHITSFQDNPYWHVFPMWRVLKVPNWKE